MAAKHEDPVKHLVKTVRILRSEVSRLHSRLDELQSRPEEILAAIEAIWRADPEAQEHSCGQCGCKKAIEPGLRVRGFQAPRGDP